MIPVVILVARLFSAPAPHVELVVHAALAAGTDPAVAVSRVEWEASFDPTAERFNAWDGSTDWGFAQFNSVYHDQHRDDLRAHVVAMERFQALCNARAAGDPRLGLAMYHRWNLDAQGLAYADAVWSIVVVVRAQGQITPRRSGGDPRIMVNYDAGAGLELLDGSRTAKEERTEKARGQARHEPEAIVERPVWRTVRAGRLSEERRAA
ncbi:hypothetical protein M0R72_13385 [Candidatus Pacearchaeota archaeon]|jgi:hypothetical protein|nr:hypothetical protein [Candidatus Pacearchaeota archaeon]